MALLGPMSSFNLPGVASVEQKAPCWKEGRRHGPTRTHFSSPSPCFSHPSFIYESMTISLLQLDGKLFFKGSWRRIFSVSFYPFPVACESFSQFFPGPNDGPAWFSLLLYIYIYTFVTAGRKGWAFYSWLASFFWTFTRGCRFLAPTPCLIFEC